MKKMTRLLALILAVSMLSTVMVGAEEANPQGAYVLPDYAGAELVFQDAEKNRIDKTYSLTVEGYEDAVTVYAEPARVSVTLDAGDGVVAGQQYVVFLLGGSDVGNTTPGEQNIRYIDQAGSDSTTISFNLYPDMLTTAGEYKIFVTSDDGKFTITEPVATFYVTEPPYDLGDVELDKDVDMDDVVALMRHVLKAETLTKDNALAAGEVNFDDILNMDDVVKIMRYVLKAITSWEQT